MPDLVSLRTEPGPTREPTRVIDPEPLAHEPVFVSRAGRRRRAVRVATAGFIAIAVLWLVAVVAGVVGFRPLPELPLVADPPTGEAATPDSAASSAGIGTEDGDTNGEVSDGVANPGSGGDAGGSEQASGGNGGSTDTTTEAPTSTTPSTDTTTSPGSSGDHANTDTSANGDPANGQEPEPPLIRGRSGDAPGRAYAQSS